MSFIRRHWKILTPLTLGFAALAAWLVFGYFGFHLLFIDDEVDEPPPVFASGAAPSGLESDATTPEMAAAMNAAMVEADTPAEAEVSEPPAMPEAPEVVELVEGMFVDRSHPTSGRAVVLNDGTEQRFLRFEDFETDNGPDLNVYLSSAPPDAPAGDFDDDFVDLGDLSGNIGPQNYEIPPDVDLDRYSTVVIWCVRFGVAFGAAELA